MKYIYIFKKVTICFVKLSNFNKYYLN